MIDRGQLAAQGAAIVLMFVSIGYAQADDAKEYPTDPSTELEIVDGVEISTKNHTDIRATADVGGDQPDVIEEIVVIGKQKSQLPNLGSGLGTNPAVEKPGWIDWQFLPRYDPEQEYAYFDQFQLDEGIRRAGFIELFRVRFGR